MPVPPQKSAGHAPYHRMLLLQLDSQFGKMAWPARRRLLHGRQNTMTQKITKINLAAVGLVFAPVLPDGRQILQQFTPFNLQQRPPQLQPATFDQNVSAASNTTGTGDATSAQHAHEHGFGLIVGGMPGCDYFGTRFFKHLRKTAVTETSCPGFAVRPAIPITGASTPPEEWQPKPLRQLANPRPVCL